MRTPLRNAATGGQSPSRCINGLFDLEGRSWTDRQSYGRIAKDPSLVVVPILTTRSAAYIWLKVFKPDPNSRQILLPITNPMSIFKRKTAFLALLVPLLADSSVTVGHNPHAGAPSSNQAVAKWYAPIPGLSGGHEARLQSFLKGPVALAETNTEPDIFSKAYSDAVLLSWDAPLPVPNDGDNSMPPPGGELTDSPFVSLSPDIIDDTYRGLVEIDIFGIAGGQRVILEKYRVFDAIAGIDSSSILKASYVLQDNYFPLTGEVFNFNVPGDIDDLPGLLSVQLDLYEPDISSTVGDYVYRVRSPTGAYSPVDIPFRVNAELSDQSFYGLVMDEEGDPIPNAFVAVLNPVGKDNTFVYGETSDSNGFYDLYTAPDEEYDLVAVAPGYVGPYGKNVSRYILEGEDIYEDIILTEGTRTISGRVHKNGDFNHGLAGVEMIFLSVDAQNEIDQSLFTATWTDQNGDYSVEVTEGRWLGLVRQNIAARFGYMGSGTGFTPADTTLGDVTNHNIWLTPGESVLHGRLTSSELDFDGEEVGIDGVSITAVRLSDGRPAHGVTDAVGSYRIALGEGRWEVYAMPNPLADRDFSPPISRTITIGPEPSSLEYNLTARPASAYANGFLTDENGDAISKLILRPFLLSGSDEIEFGARNTDETDGFFNFALGVGDWLIMPDPTESAQRQLLFGSFPEVTVKPLLEPGESPDLPTIDADFQTHAPTGEIVLTMVNSSGMPVPGVIVHGELSVGKDTYNTFGRSDANGEARLAVIDGEWQIDLSGPSLSNLGFSEVPRFAVTASGTETTQTVPLTAFSNETPQLVPTIRMAEEGVQFQGTGEAGQRYFIEGSQDLTNWRELGQVNAVDGDFSLLPDEATQGLDRLFLRLRLEP